MHILSLGLKLIYDPCLVGTKGQDYTNTNVNQN